MDKFYDTKDISDVLQRLGLNDQEATIYVTMLQMSNASIRKIAEATKINRGATYEALKSLVTKGLVRQYQRGERVAYAAEEPNKIYELIKDQRKELLQTQQVAQKLIPRLESQRMQAQGSPLVRYYEDDEGVVAILKDVLATCPKLDTAEYYAYSSKPLRHYLYRRFPRFTDRRIQEGINVKVIAIGEGGDKVAASERRWMKDTEEDRATSYTIIYGNKVASISISEDETPYGVVIEDAGVASMQRLLFEQVWRSLPA